MGLRIMPLEPEPDGPALAAEEGQTLLQRLGHWCRVQPNKVNKRQRRVAINRSANASDEYLLISIISFFPLPSGSSPSSTTRGARWTP